MAPDLIGVPAAATLSLAGCLVYASRTLQGKVRPNGVTWLLWSVAPLIVFAAELSRQVGIAALTTLSVGLGPMLVFASAVARKGTLHRPSRAELACGTMSLLALAAWWRTQQPDAAVALGIAADALATFPTLAKARRDPLSEDSCVYFCVAVGSLLTLATLTRWSFASMGFPSYLLLLCGALAFMTRPRSAHRIAPPSPWRSAKPSTDRRRHGVPGCARRVGHAVRGAVRRSIGRCRPGSRGGDDAVHRGRRAVRRQPLPQHTRQRPADASTHANPIGSLAEVAGARAAAPRHGHHPLHAPCTCSEDRPTGTVADGDADRSSTDTGADVVDITIRPVSDRLVNPIPADFTAEPPHPGDGTDQREDCAPPGEASERPTLPITSLVLPLWEAQPRTPTMP
ncbi:hypothetical protein [Streptomyces sp. NPDC048527]|uniref:hypothetical protein n=1 Tax=Streptomyces sp. NPDC048527 TaxID=3365568 RepID=UPI003715D355